MNTPTTYKPIATMITCRQDDEDAMVALREYRELERENARLKDTLKTGETPDPVWSKDDLCFMYRKALEERDEADKENAVLRADRDLLDSNTIWLTVDGQPVWFDGCDLRKAIQAAIKYKNPQSKS